MMIVSWLGPILGVFLIDLILSGDNALVIGVTASQLPRRQRMIAIIVGGGAAIVLRIVFALAATLLLQLRFIGIVGGFILLFIAMRLLFERSTERRSARRESSPTAEPLSNKNQRQVEPSHIEVDGPVRKRRVRNNLFGSIITILFADVTMSLDNILAIGGLAAGNILPLVIGLLFSVIFLLIGSALIAELGSHVSLLLDLACLILAWTASQVFLGDDVLNDLLLQMPWISFVAPAVALMIVLLIDIFVLVRDRRYLRRL